MATASTTSTASAGSTTLHRSVVCNHVKGNLIISPDRLIFEADENDDNNGSASYNEWMLDQIQTTKVNTASTSTGSKPKLKILFHNASAIVFTFATQDKLTKVRNDVKIKKKNANPNTSNTNKDEEKQKQQAEEDLTEDMSASNSPLVAVEPVELQGQEEEEEALENKMDDCTNKEEDLEAAQPSSNTSNKENAVVSSQEQQQLQEQVLWWKRPVSVVDMVAAAVCCCCCVLPILIAVIVVATSATRSSASTGTAGMQVTSDYACELDVSTNQHTCITNDASAFAGLRPLGNKVVALCNRADTVVGDCVECAVVVQVGQDFLPCQACALQGTKDGSHYSFDCSNLVYGACVGSTQDGTCIANEQPSGGGSSSSTSYPETTYSGGTGGGINVWNDDFVQITFDQIDAYGNMQIP